MPESRLALELAIVDAVPVVVPLGLDMRGAQQLEDHFSPGEAAKGVRSSSSSRSQCGMAA
jgi:hypothetical protein